MQQPIDRSRGQGGFTLVELIMVIVIIGVVGGMVAVFMKSPIDAYFDSARRAALTDVADTTMRRMARDIRKALPNTISTSADGTCLEFIPTRTGGRYRSEEIVAGDGTSLVFGTAETRFNMVGSNNALPADQRIVIGDVIALSNFGFGEADAFVGTNTALVSGVTSGTETAISIAPAVTFVPALASPSFRFLVIPANEKVVAYVCSANNLYRVARTTLAHLCPVTVASTDPLLARNVATAACSFQYSGSDLQRNGLVNMKIQMSDGGETVTLQHEVHVNNTP